MNKKIRLIIDGKVSMIVKISDIETREIREFAFAVMKETITRSAAQHLSVYNDRGYQGTILVQVTKL